MDSGRVNGFSALLILLGVIIILTLWAIFPVCEMHGLFDETKTGTKLPIPCGYTDRADSGIGALIVVSVGLLIANKTPNQKQVVGVFSITHGLQVILYPTVLIGMCKLAEHPCRFITSYPRNSWRCSDNNRRIHYKESGLK